MRLARSGAVVAVCLALAGCASVTNGAGNGSGAPSSLTVPGASTAPTSSASVLPPLPTNTATSPSSAPVPEPPPAVCQSGGCTKNANADIGDGYTVTLYTASGQNGSAGSSVLELSAGETPVFWQVTDEQVAGDLGCSPDPTPNCVVVGGVGAHASVATGYTRDLDRLVKYDDVPSDTPSTDPIDLNGDGLIDVVTAINTYQPSYATGTVYWQTFQSTGTTFESTGCTKPLHTLPPEPTAPLTGSCPS